jgi:hypothetical protein
VTSLNVGLRLDFHVGSIVVGVAPRQPCPFLILFVIRLHDASLVTRFNALNKTNNHHRKREIQR